VGAPCIKLLRAASIKFVHCGGSAASGPKFDCLGGAVD
jgi:hypothetical protein